MAPGMVSQPFSKNSLFLGGQGVPERKRIPIVGKYFLKE